MLKYANDHNSPALVELPSGMLVAFWSLHGQENCFYTQLIDPEESVMQSARKTVVVGNESKITYSNPFYLASESRLYNFFRGLDDSRKPSWVYSYDEGETWSEGRILINVPGNQRRRPYVKYASDGEGVIHFFFTEDHPRDFQNNVYHMAYQSGVGLCDSTGKYIADLETGISTPQEATLVWKSSPSQTAWVIDAKLDKDGAPTLLFQVREKDPKRLKTSLPGSIAYYLATFKDGTWSNKYLTHSGPALYPAEEDYVGLGCLNHLDSKNLVISTVVDPRNNRPLKYWTLFEGRISVPSGEVLWKRVAKRSKDCLRPILIPEEDGKSRLYWLEGKYHSYTSYELSIMSKRLQTSAKA